MMRDKMPWSAAIVAELREAFGANEMNQVLRTGLAPDCEPRLRVYFSEAGHVLGKPFVDTRPSVAADQMVIGDQVVSVKRGRR